MSDFLKSLDPDAVMAARIILGAFDAESFAVNLGALYDKMGRLVQITIEPNGRIFVGGNDPDEMEPDAPEGNLYVEVVKTDAGWRLTPDYTDYADAEMLLEDTLWKLLVIDEDNAAYRATRSIP